MAVRIRLSRTGKKNQPSYRIVVADQRTKRDGKAIEVLGFYQPLTEPATIKVDRARFDYWLSVGAQPSEPVQRLILGQKRIRTKIKKEEKREPVEKTPKEPAPPQDEKETKAPAQTTEVQKEPQAPEAQEKTPPAPKAKEEAEEVKDKN